MYQEHPFIFSRKYRLLRHLIFWTVHCIIFTFLWRTPKLSFGVNLLWSAGIAVLIIIYCYPVMYWILPQFLLKEKYGLFAIIMLVWGVLGVLWNYVCRIYFTIPIQDYLHVKTSGRSSWASGSFLTIMSMTGFGSMIVLFKYWMKKQRDFLSEQKEKINAELQLLKAQIHPHFLFNTLNNIYSFSMKGSPKTTDMIARLSSLLSYVLYDCKNHEVLLSKEIQVMKDYIDLEKERYGNRLEISTNMIGDIQGKFIAPLLLLPFIENAFKHGTSEQLEKPWLSIDLSVKQNVLQFKIVNSKNEFTSVKQKGIGIENVQKRLSYLYEGKYELKLNDEGNFFVVSLTLELDPPALSGKSYIATLEQPESLPA